VLPFANLSADEENEYFADGLTEELLNVLANIRGLRVASRTSAFFFKGKDADIATVAARLGVSSILEGSVRKSGKRVRITAQLIDVASDSHLWSNKYDRELDDIFAVQDDIAKAVVAELKGALLGGSKAAAAAESEVKVATLGRASNPEAHELYLQARFQLNRWTPEANKQGRDLLLRALALDPKFAAAWADLSLVLFSLASYGAIPAREGYEGSADAARRALDCEPDLAEGYVGLFRVLAAEWKWSEATAAIERAYQLAPNNARVLRTYGTYLGSLGRHEEALEHLRQARLLDPLARVSHFNLGGRLLFMGRLEEALASYEQAYSIDPRGGLVHAGPSLVLLLMGKFEQCLERIAQEQVPLAKLSIIAMAEHSLGHRERSDEALAALVEQCRSYGSYQIASTYAWRGESDKAFEWLEESCKRRDPSLAAHRVDPFLNRLHSDERWIPLVRRIGLPG